MLKLVQHHSSRLAFVFCHPELVSGSRFCSVSPPPEIVSQCHSEALAEESTLSILLIL